MDQVESSTPGRPLTFSGRNNKRTSLLFHSLLTVFLDMYMFSSSQASVRSKSGFQKYVSLLRRMYVSFEKLEIV